MAKDYFLAAEQLVKEFQSKPITILGGKLNDLSNMAIYETDYINPVAI